MSTVLARRVASSPIRTAAQTWAKIVEIIAPDPQSPARRNSPRPKAWLARQFRRKRQRTPPS